MQLPEMSDLFFGQGGSQRRHRGRDPALLDGNHIHIAFRHDQRQFAPHPLARLHPAIKNLFLREGRPLAGIEIFWLRIAKGAGPKGNHPSLPILDRKHHPVAKIVIERTIAVTAPDHAGSQHVIITEPACRQGGTQPASRRIAQTVSRQCRLTKPAPLQIARRRRPVIAQQRRLKETRGFFQYIERRLALSLAIRVFRHAARHLHAGHAGK